ncbi:MAG TPA: toll/interleukin-1 receptor domain-containing protein [Longimicrobium sp.]|jgi:hypothetical protein
MKAFISHNAADKETARLLASRLVERGIDVWFDEWQLRPGDSITGGIETGIGECDTFVTLWSFVGENVEVGRHRTSSSGSPPS